MHIYMLLQFFSFLEKHVVHLVLLQIKAVSAIERFVQGCLQTLDKDIFHHTLRHMSAHLRSRPVMFPASTVASQKC